MFISICTDTTGNAASEQRNRVASRCAADLKGQFESLHNNKKGLLFVFCSGRVSVLRALNNKSIRSTSCHLMFRKIQDLLSIKVAVVHINVGIL